MIDIREYAKQVDEGERLSKEIHLVQIERNKLRTNLETSIRVASELIVVWDRQHGRFLESMGRENPRLQAVEEKIERLRMETSKYE